MKQTRLPLYTACLLSLMGATTYVWSQQRTTSDAELDPRQPEYQRETLGGGGLAPESSSAPSVRRRANLDDDDRPRAMGGRGGMPGLSHVPMRTRIVTEMVRQERAISEPVSQEELEAIRVFQEALNVLKDSKDEEARKKASDAIQAQLVKQFEQDLKQRQQELAAVEERVTSLRHQLEKRKASQAEIISLRLKTIINNADGLGFPGDPGANDPSTTFSDPAEGNRLLHDPQPRGLGGRGANVEFRRTLPRDTIEFDFITPEPIERPASPRPPKATRK